MWDKASVRDRRRKLKPVFANGEAEGPSVAVKAACPRRKFGFRQYGKRLAGSVPHTQPFEDRAAPDRAEDRRNSRQNRQQARQARIG